MFREDEYEKSIIELLKDLGYRHVEGGQVERAYDDPFFEEELESALIRLNPDMPRNALAEARRKLLDLGTGDLVMKNAVFTDYLQNGISVTFEKNGENRSGIVYLMDAEDPSRNSFVAANQWTFTEHSKRRADIILFINGLPLVFMELKSPSNEQTDVSDAYAQIRNYLQEIPTLFHYNAVCVISDMLTSRAGTITAGADRFMEWKTKDGQYENKQYAGFDTFIEGMFEPRRLLDILSNFICFSRDGAKQVKILGAYHQYFAVRKAIESTKKAVKKDGRAGVFWHTQGSGKSLSMVFYAHLLQQALDNPTIVVLTDRNDLDDQLFGQFSRCRDFLRQTPVQAESREDLVRLLDGRAANGIIFTTLQKFTERSDALSERRNIVVMADEAHRSQYGLTEKVRLMTNEKGEEIAKRSIGSALLIRKALPNATYIGFTGTPVSLSDRNTQEVFGDMIDVYDMTQAVEDGATRPVFYESRVVKLHLDDRLLKEIDQEYEVLTTQTEPDVVERSKKKLARMEELLGAPSVIESLTRDILEHYETYRAHLLTGKAMIVAYSREIALKIYRRLLELRPQWEQEGKVAVVMTESNKDPEEWRPIIGNRAKREHLGKKFKDNDDPLKIVIVVDMWLTGFDVPSLATMYVYKPMKDHNLMQAIARVNRVFKDKEGGLVVDYIGIASALKKAMNDYTARDRQNYGDPDIAKVAYPKFSEKLEVCRHLLHGLDYDVFFDGTDLQRGRIITEAVNFLLDTKRQDDKKYFLNEALQLHKAQTLCASLIQPRDRAEASFMEAVRVLLMRLDNNGGEKKLSLHEVNARINDLLKQSIKSDGVINLFENKNEEFSLFDEKFLQEVKQMRCKNVALELLKRLITGQVSTYRRTNIVRSEEFSEKMKKVMNSYLNGMLTNEEVIEELVRMAQDIKRAQEEGAEQGLTPEELSIYDALAQPDGIREVFNNDVLLAMARELTEQLRNCKTIDWQYRQDARAKMRATIKRLLKKYNYPPKGWEQTIETVIKQCELVA